MRGYLSSKLTPLDAWIIRQAASGGFGYVARLAVAPHTGQSQKAHDVGVWFDQFESRVERIAGDMKQNGKTSAKFEFKGFVNVRLSDDDKASLLASEPSEEAMMETIGALLYSGYKLSISFDRYSGAQQATLTCVDAACENYGFAISARHPGLIMALATLLYKHFDLCQGVWANGVGQLAERGWD